jgi:hypothetical protein
MISDGDGKPESKKTDAEELARRLEIELAQKRAAWAETGARYRRIRAASLLFLALVVMGALFAFFFLFTHLTQERPARGSQPDATSSPAG